jgi:hypothetical protein
MSTIIRQRITLIMAMLFAVTFISWRLGNIGENKIGTTIIILIAAFKIRYVMLDFMAVRAAPFILRLFCNVWITAVACIIIILQWLAPGSTA